MRYDIGKFILCTGFLLTFSFRSMAQDPAATSTLKLVSGTLSGNPITPQYRSFWPSAGSRITGQIVVQITAVQDSVKFPKPPLIPLDLST